jgi:AMMECR1 domain-containing protein
MNDDSTTDSSCISTGIFVAFSNEEEEEEIRGCLKVSYAILT